MSSNGKKKFRAATAWPAIAVILLVIAALDLRVHAEERSTAEAARAPGAQSNPKDQARKEVEALERAEEEAEYEAEGADNSEAENEKSEAVPSAPPSSDSGPKRESAFKRFFRRLFNWGGTDTSKEGGERPETDESQAGTPDALTLEGDTGTISPDEYLSEEYLSASRPWEPPNYAGQDSALGWKSNVFDVPKSMRKRVDFWVAIYAKYSTNQGLLHDTVFPEVVYEAIDFTPIMKDQTLTDYQKARERERLVKARRAFYEERLRKLAKVKSPEGLSDEDLRIWKMWQPIDDEDKYVEAVKKNRIRFQLGQKDKFFVGLYYSGRYLREMERIFRDAGLPIELTRLPFVESSFNIFARSKVGASGVWQFMRRTARPYMMVNKDVDERNDPIEATRASAKLLKSNYQLLERWPLAVTGYNHGPYGVRGIVNKLGTRDLAEIIGKYKSRTFGFASENFYACFLAALEVERNAGKYFGDVRWSTPFEETMEIPVSKPVPYKALLALYGGDDTIARLQNFHLQSRVRDGKSQIPRGTFIRVPAAKRNDALALMHGSIKSMESPGTNEPAAAASASATEKSATSLAAARSLRSGEESRPTTERGKPKRYRVRRGDNLSRISRRFDVSVSELKKANDLEDGRIQRGQWLTIPD